MFKGVLKVKTLHYALKFYMYFIIFTFFCLLGFSYILHGEANIPVLFDYSIIITGIFGSMIATHLMASIPKEKRKREHNFWLFCSFLATILTWLHFIHKVVSL